MPEEITVSGMAELRQTLLTNLPEALQGKASQAALAKAAQPIVRDAQARAPSRAERFVGPMPDGKKIKGTLKRSIYSYRNRESTRTYESRFIGVRRRAWYWRLIEFGRAAITSTSGSLGTVAKGFFGKKVTAVPAKPFLRPAFEANKERAITIYRDALLPAIKKVAEKSRMRSFGQIRKKLVGR